MPPRTRVPAGDQVGTTSRRGRDEVVQSTSTVSGAHRDRVRPVGPQCPVRDESVPQRDTPGDDVAGARRSVV